MRNRSLRFARPNANNSPGTRIFVVATGGIAPKPALEVQDSEQESLSTDLIDEPEEGGMEVDKGEMVTSAVTTPDVLIPGTEQPDVAAVTPISPAVAPIAQHAVEPELDNRSLSNLPLFIATKAKTPSPDEVEAFWWQFIVRAEMAGVFLTTPKALTKLLLMCLREDALVWFVNLQKANSTTPLSGEALKVAFWERWAPTARTTVGEAYDELHAGTLKQGNDTVAKFKAKFDSALMPIMHEVSEPLLVRAFANGLNHELSIACQCDDSGKEYTKLNDVYNAALGHERKFARRMLLKRSSASLNALQGRSSSPLAGGSGAKRTDASPSPARQSNAWQQGPPRHVNKDGTDRRGRGAPYSPNRGNGADHRGRGGQFPRNPPGPDGPSFKRAKMDPKLDGSGWFTPTGREINWYEHEGYRKNGICFNCFDLSNKHLSENCPLPRHAFPRVVKQYPKKNP